MIPKVMEEKVRNILAIVGKNARISSIQRVAQEEDAEVLVLSLLDTIEKKLSGEYRYTAMLHDTAEQAAFQGSVEKAKQLLETEEATA